MDRRRDKLDALVMPHSQETEQAVLGSMIVSPLSTIPLAKDLLLLDDFYYPSHQIIYDALLQLDFKEITPDILSLADDLRSRGLLDQVNGESYLTALVCVTPDASAFESHCRVLKQKAGLRQLIDHCRRTTREAFADGANVLTVLGEMEDGVQRVSARLQRTVQETPVEAINKWISESLVIGEDGQPHGRKRAILTGWGRHDATFGGFEPSEYILLSGNPGAGKTAWLLTLTLNLAKQDKRVAFLSFEMSPSRLAARLFAQCNEIPLWKLLHGEFDIGRLSRSDALWNQIELLTPSATIPSLKSEIRRVAGKGVEVIFVDYIQLLGQNNEELMAVSKALKTLATECGMVVVTASQLTKEGKRGLFSASELYGASLDNDPDRIYILVPSRETPVTERYLPVELRVLKHRDGATGTLAFSFDRRYVCYSETEEESYG